MDASEYRMAMMGASEAVTNYMYQSVFDQGQMEHHHNVIELLSLVHGLPQLHREDIIPEGTINNPQGF